MLRWLGLLLAAARHVVVLISVVAVLAFAAIELVPLPITVIGSKHIVTIPAIDDVFANVWDHKIVAVTPVDDVIA